MEAILQAIKNVTVFVLVFSIVSNLFARSKYQKYFSFIEGVILLMLILTPLVSSFRDEHVLDVLLEQNVAEREQDAIRDELRMIGEERDRFLTESWTEGGGSTEHE